MHRALKSLHPFNLMQLSRVSATASTTMQVAQTFLPYNGNEIRRINTLAVLFQ